MPNLTSVTVTAGVPTSGTGTVSTLDALMADGGQATTGAQADAAYGGLGSATAIFRVKGGVITSTARNDHGTVIRFPNPPIQEGRAVKRLNVVDFYEVGAALNRLSSLISSSEHTKIMDAWWPLHSAAVALDQFASQEAFQLARAEALTLSSVIHAFVRDEIMTKNDKGQDVFKDANTEFSSFEFYRVRSALDSFTHVFKAECRDNETYFIEQKAIYHTASLVGRASDKIHVTFRPYVVPAAMQEIDEAGRCFAVDSYTACGFHALRGLEIVMEDYYEALKKKKPKFRSWYDYVKAFKTLANTRAKRQSKYPSPKVAAMIDRIRDRPENGSHRAHLLPLVRAGIEAIIEREGVFRDPKPAGCFVAVVTD